ncbi:MAG TPA: GTPase [Phycisphaerae bacterium]|nr:GTPase [Phycisphaerae bacterium]
MTLVMRMTARGMGAIAVLRVAGPEARQIIARFSGTAASRVQSLRPGEAARLQLTEGDESLDDALLVCIADESLELHLHGGTAVVDAVLAALQRTGAKEVEPSEAPEAATGARGILADVMLALPHAATMTGARLLASQVDTGLGAWATHWRHHTTPDNLWHLHSECQWLCERSRELQRLLSPARVALIGPPNAGKSTLANALLGRPVAITSDLPGTTRDWVDAPTTFTAATIHAPVILVDTAGIRETADPLEQESIHRTHGQARAADLVILVLDAADPASWNAALDAGRQARAQLIALNKCDLIQAPPQLPTNIETVAVSAKDHAHLEELMTASLRRLGLSAIDEAEPFIFAARQCDILESLALAPTLPGSRDLLDRLLQT